MTPAINPIALSNRKEFIGQFNKRFFILKNTEGIVTNIQIRLLAASIGLVAGGLAGGNVGLAIILLIGAIFLAEYVRSYMNN